MHCLLRKCNIANPGIPKQPWKSEEIFYKRDLRAKMSMRSTDLGFALTLENKLLTGSVTETSQ